ncbi:hypothetical protein FCM35_KLT10342 [Carex littledalei]|uniref:Uncharacterized protein n=1 Tax=Carex littledalei TaxID=544730 RepID=A0A833V4S4_9POAL|nr:hypothetical protein FCM35_KLT10342 [Carex littledalei]
MIRDIEARPEIVLYWHDELNMCSMCEKKRWHRCEFNIETKKSFCLDSHMVLKASMIPHQLCCHAHG